MSRPVVWFLSGVLATTLVLSGVMVAVSQFGAEAEAQGTWQVQRFPDGNESLSSALQWVASLPSDCDFVISNFNDIYYYRCPE